MCEMTTRPTKTETLAEEDDVQLAESQADALPVTKLYRERKKSQPKRAGCLAGKPTTELHGKATTPLHEKTTTEVRQRTTAIAQPPRPKAMPSPLAGNAVVSLHG